MKLNRGGVRKDPIELLKAVLILAVSGPILIACLVAAKVIGLVPVVAILFGASSWINLLVRRRQEKRRAEDAPSRARDLGVQIANARSEIEGLRAELGSAHDGVRILLCASTNRLPVEMAEHMVQLADDPRHAAGVRTILQELTWVRRQTGEGAVGIEHIGGPPVWAADVLGHLDTMRTGRLQLGAGLD